MRQGCFFFHGERVTGEVFGPKRDSAAERSEPFVERLAREAVDEVESHTAESGRPGVRDGRSDGPWRMDSIEEPQLEGIERLSAE